VNYDAAGNMVDGSWYTFRYDATGQQTRAACPGYTLDQVYDGDRLRGKKVEDGVTTYYLRSSVLGGQVIAELSNTGAWTRGYVYLGGQMVALQGGSGGAVSWVHQDPVNKSQRITDSSGNIVSKVELDPFGGDTLASSSAAFQPHRFTSYERDALGADDAMMRRYNRYWGRFDQPDPYDGSYDATNPQSFNRYAYVQNDPVNFVDPSGLNLAAPGSTSCFGSDVAYYLDGVLTDGRTVCSVLQSGGGAIQSHNVEGLTVINQFQLDRYERLIWTGQIVHFFNPGIGGSPLEPITQEKAQLERNLAHDPKNFDIYDRCLRKASADQLGLTELFTGLANAPLSKRALGLSVTGGASEVTNPISYAGHRWFRGANLPFRMLGTNRIAGVLGRLAPVAAIAMSAWDFAKILDKTNDCYNRVTGSK
jgi:RHS repeat-associated protein